MNETNRLITDKLQKYSVPVQKLASKALLLADTLPVTTVVERLKGIVRSIVRDDCEVDDDTP